MTRIHTLLRDTAGGVLIFTALSFVLLLGVAGAGIDLGRQQLVRIHIQQAADAAALAGSLEPVAANRKATAERYFSLNYPDNYLGIARPTPSVDLANGVAVSANAVVPTIFMQFLLVSSMNAGGRSLVKLDTSSTQKGRDFILLMDNSGSMEKKDIPSGAWREGNADATTSARSVCRNYGVINEAFGGNISSINDWCNKEENGLNPSAAWNFGRYNNTRLNALRQAATTLTNIVLPAGNTLNRIATVTWSNQLFESLNFTTNGTNLQAFLDRMYAFGGTNSYFALQKAEDLASGFDPDHVKAIVLLTDGMNTNADVLHYYGGPNPIYDAYGCTGYSTDHCQAADDLSLPVCTSLKNKGYFIFTISFSVSSTEKTFARNLLYNCASDVPGGGDKTDRYYFEAPDAAKLTEAFKAIDQITSKVRIAE